MEFGGESEVHHLAKKFKDSIELGKINTEETKKKTFTPFRTKYENAPSHEPFRTNPSTSLEPFRTRYENTSNLDKIHTVEQELFKLKDIQSQVLSMKETMEGTIEKEVKKAKEKEVRELRHQYKTRIRELEVLHKKKEESLKQEYEEKLHRVTTCLKDKIKEMVAAKVAAETDKARNLAEKKILEISLRDKAVIDKLSQMYIDLKEKYKRDIQGQSTHTQ
ncbi:hypothetical protein NEDG_00466 [Nematocida displodere]|uniref:Uncharacterized protein n=1 Tax=Nematocida displodere TaxID=1805483 RepID=A0A177EKK6_9MICR|nr:hypothetical protein NEDG_00466 [Nematocida displodere]